MAIKIELKSTIIPVEIGELKFQIDVSDVNMEVLESKVSSFLKEVDVFTKDLNDGSTPIKQLEEASEELVEQFEEVYGELLGADSFKKIYEKMPCMVFMAQTFIQIMSQVKSELSYDHLLWNLHDFKKEKG